VPQPTPNQVAGHRIAHSAADNEADPGLGLSVSGVVMEHDAGARDPAAAAYGEREVLRLR
jgi:hypothetical protein